LTLARAGPVLERLVNLAKGDGSSGSILARSATARGQFKHIIEVNGHLVINDGGLLRELNFQEGSIYTLCHQRKQTKGKINLGNTLKKRKSLLCRFENICRISKGYNNLAKDFLIAS